MRRVDFGEVDWDEHARVVHDGELFSGQVIETGPGDQVIAVTTYLDGIEDGPSEEWYPSGERKARGPASHGRAVGLHQEWYRNGRLAAETEFDSEGHQLFGRKWDESGILTEEKIHYP